MNSRSLCARLRRLEAARQRAAPSREWAAQRLAAKSQPYDWAGIAAALGRVTGLSAEERASIGLPLGREEV